MITLGATGGIAVVLVVVLLFGVLIFFLRRNQASHAADAAALNAWATDHGYAYAERDDQTWTGRWRFLPFGTGDTQHADHVVTGRFGELDFGAFDYNFTNYGATASSSATFHYAMIVVVLPTALPWFGARKRQFHALPHSPDDNEFPVGDQAFDDHYIVHADDRSYALTALTPALRALIVEQKLQGLRVVDGRLFAWVDQTHNKVATLPGRLAAVTEAATALPAAPPPS